MMKLLAPLATDLGSHASGWATASLIRSVRRVALGLIAVWQLVMILAAAISLGWAAWPLMLLHLSLACLAALAPARFPRMPLWPLPLGMAVLGLADYVWSGDLTSVLVFAACWQINFASVAFGLIVLRPVVTPLVMAVAVSLSVALFVMLPDWGSDLPISIVVTQTSIILALRYGLPALFDLSRGTDQQERASADAVHRAEVAHRTGLQISEDTRVLHDTAVNTLGAIANGGEGTADSARVRTQCARDLAVLASLREDRLVPVQAGPRLLEALRSSWLPTHRSGLRDEEIEILVSGEDPQTVDGFGGAVREALTNAGKHSGATEVFVAITVADSALTVEVRDQGSGFDPRSVALRGVAQSIQERSTELGFSARIETAPGQGTRVALALPLGIERLQDRDTMGTAARVEATTGALLQRASLLWALGVTAVSVILSLANEANYTGSTLIMLLLMASSWGWAHAAHRKRPSKLFTAFLVVAPSLIFVCAAATTAFGTANAIHWQALAPTAPFVLLIARRQLRRERVLAAIIWGATALAIVVSGSAPSDDAMAIVAVAGAVGLGFGIVWSQFQAAVEKLCLDGATAAQRTFWANVETSAAESAQRTYLRWIHVGLEPTILLLQEIAAAKRDPRARETRAACGYEELYLRQAIQVGPELVHLGPSVFPVMRQAHDRGVELTLRLGDQDATDLTAANSIVEEIAATVAAARPGDRVTASLFPVREGLQLTIIRVPSSPQASTPGLTTAQLLFPGSLTPA